MRSFYSIRSIGIGSAVIVASLFSFFLVSAPASAEVVPLDAGIQLKVEKAADFAFLAFDVLPAAEAEQLADHPGLTSLMAFSALHPLKPEYAESYQTHGLNFIDVRRRC
ncbi:hypothetical protein B5K08_15845 [Rhizobium leguminosarum bv. trifolii]|uniref:Uncharacterized protein n=1 Tax=Rhizobium leguminosarum bv. trifolii TaxID=386 RepID=A0A3E1BGU6_RHILT|nr:hypothetical protein [Rhizobium leguminosarum]RFB91769.1 hypothetical protein B5K08_15845 [Rhizobium leguminosarum bv. trifolii]RFB92286.1 hypothetical protein B5K10_15840 [Rhizobium leguminosarum bv. trifolii]